jgi:hypothetical protein
MPNTGTPQEKIAGSTVGLPGSYTLLGPPEITMPRADANSQAGVSLARTSA